MARKGLVLVFSVAPCAWGVGGSRCVGLWCRGVNSAMFACVCILQNPLNSMCVRRVVLS